ncbi:hypothetical protein [Desertimonas flava]|uniref:hypothetical protein n=1 Tax=Desertimonas flava TaxID=2064846 RepID=UPI0013C51932|nr:hypothetical protein [Desertimonas flava]
MTGSQQPEPAWALPGDPGRVVAALDTAVAPLDAESLLRRALAFRVLGHGADAAADLAAAEQLPAAHALRRWACALRADFTFNLDGDDTSAWTLTSTLVDGALSAVDAALAKAHEVRSQILAAKPTRSRLHQADRDARQAIEIWERLRLGGNARAVRANRVTDVLVPLGRYDEALAEFDGLLASSDTTNEAGRLRLLRAFAALDAGDLDASGGDLDSAEVLARTPLHPLRLATVAWGRALIACRRGDRTGARRLADRAERSAVGAGHSWALPLWCDLSIEFGALGDLDLADSYLQRARDLDPDDASVRHAEFVLDARSGRLGDVDAVLESIPPGLWGRTLAVAASAASRAGATDEADELARFAADELAAGGAPAEPAVEPSRGGRGYVRLYGERMIVLDGDGHEVRLDGPTQRAFVAFVAARPGATPSQVASALYPDESPAVGMRRVRTVAKRVREVFAGLVELRNGRFSPGVECDLHEAVESAEQAAGLARWDRDMATHSAFAAVVAANGPLLAEFAARWAGDVRAEVEAVFRPSIELLAGHAAGLGDDPSTAQWARLIA